MVSIDVMGGSTEIGGNKILVEHNGTRILLDFGMSFSQNSRYFSEFLNPRKCTALIDYLEMGLLPDIKGIYREDYLNHMGRPPEERAVDAVFLSHAHADHAQYIHFLRFDIPIYCTEETHIILQCLEEVGTGTISDLTSACETFVFYENTKGNRSRVTRRNTEYVHDRDFHIMEPEQSIRIGSLEIEMVPVDHSLPGACGYFIYSDEGNIVYTGDIRFHGYERDKSERFVEKAASCRPKWLLCEGTRLDSNDTDSEQGVRDEIGRIVASSKDLVFVEHPVRDLYRVKSIFDAARAAGRELVVGLKLAYLIEAFGDLAPFSLDDVKILVPMKSWGLLYKNGIERMLVEGDYSKWERDFLFRDNSITCEELRKYPKKYVVSMNMWEINQLIDIKPHDAVWIKSSCEPFSDEMDIDEERKKKWLEHFGIQLFSAHASGHASGDEIRDMVGRIAPEQVIPIHTEHPEMFKL
ncbi:MAG: MBL fold metallo-hydrolase [ANME-2 cluster archaeon]|nr:MBL fold metallo-hydrolase [ANME-2 cluster archaeon]